MVKQLVQSSCKPKQKKRKRKVKKQIVIDTDADPLYTGYCRSARVQPPVIAVDASTAALNKTVIAIRPRIRDTERRALSACSVSEPKSPKTVERSVIDLSGSDTDDPLQEAPPHSLVKIRDSVHRYFTHYHMDMHADAASQRLREAVEKEVSEQGF